MPAVENVRRGGVGKMFATARRVDALGRIVLPAELRRSLGIAEGDHLEVREVDGAIVLAKNDDECTLCGSHTELVEHNNRHVCGSCIAQLTTKARGAR